MSGKLLKSALIAPLAALLLMLAAPVPAQAANEGRDPAFGSPGWLADQQDRWSDRGDSRHYRRVEWRKDRRGVRRDDRHDQWGERRHGRRDRWQDRRDRRHDWRQSRWWRHWGGWDRRSGQRRNRHRHGQRWHPHRY